MTRVLTLSFLLLLTTYNLQLTTAFAEELTVSAQVDRTEVASGGQVVFSVTIAGTEAGLAGTGAAQETPKIRVEGLERFQVLSTGQSQQIQVKGQEVQRALGVSYTLRPTGEGVHTLGPVHVEYRGKTYDAPPIEVKVVERPAPARPPKLQGGVVL